MMKKVGHLIKTFFAGLDKTTQSGNSQEVKGHAQLKGRAMPKMCERGNAQKLLSKTGNSQEVKGYAQLKGRAVPKMCERGYAQKQK